jgi:adenylosuccinate synthase
LLNSLHVSTLVTVEIGYYQQGEVMWKFNGGQAGYADVLVGLQYGDEGKAKIIDLLTPNYDIVARFNGGANAGHTIVTSAGKFALQQVPSAVTHPTLALYIGSGCVVNPEKLIREIEELERAGLSVRPRLQISPRASLVQPHHILIDSLTGADVGTTKNGIGMAYADRARRMHRGAVVNVRLGDLLSSLSEVIERAKYNLSVAAKEYEVAEPGPEVIESFATACRAVLSLVARDPQVLVKSVARGARVLFEGAQSVMLDVQRGTVPFVTSSATLVGAAYTGGDLPPKYHRKSIGVAKLLMSRVGRGPFASEFGGSQSEAYCMEDGGAKHTREFEKKSYNVVAFLRSTDPFELGVALRMLSHEYGTVTGRPRRIGALDLAQLREVVADNGIDELYLTKADLLREFADTATGTIPVVTQYEFPKSELPISTPVTQRDFEVLKAVYAQYPAFSQSIEGVRSYEGLPPEIQQLIADIEKVTGARVVGIGTGPARDELVLR